MTPIATVAISGDISFEKDIAFSKVKISQRKTSAKALWPTTVAVNAKRPESKDDKDKRNRFRVQKDTRFVCSSGCHYANRFSYWQTKTDGGRAEVRDGGGRRLRGHFHRQGHLGRQKGKFLRQKYQIELHMDQLSWQTDQSHTTWDLNQQKSWSSYQIPAANQQYYRPNPPSHPPFQRRFTVQLHFRGTLATVDEEKSHPD